ncbi:TetR/AcrR family transcriptional regulator [Catenulispora sp. NF23]|uniref:TetR/AcrR family transcriptional regulator n=1 Tax=Catenulispora pinistramenti TaxID=2705254 RepID=A0ABS5KK20_9ACTN|nr:TetR/AcrR family transcriptional regulator [Catenulispora pinistramenti]MBS2533330.1 TetR/AcrR family transcriptional regulator [Catenulispora pinistramenti]MBS2546400.1 TetR/AcrR family transcriptional regulator [Catenulispora pinistramenti]
MPRISEQRRALRRRQILTSAWVCFSRNGFHATSMDDIIAAAGGSASGVYRYFAGKNELIDAAGEESMAVFRALFDRLRATEPVPDLATTLAALSEPVGAGEEYDLSRVAIQAWSEALRQPRLRERTAEFHQEMRAQLTELARRWQQTGELGPRASPDAVGLLLATLLPGMLVARHTGDRVTGEQVLAGLRGLAGIELA